MNAPHHQVSPMGLCWFEKLTLLSFIGVIILVTIVLFGDEQHGELKSLMITCCIIVAVVQFQLVMTIAVRWKLC